jgi:hypothetical protein
VQEIVEEIRIGDLTPTEMVSLLTILRPARERRRQPARVLELVRSGKRRRRQARPPPTPPEFP